MPKEQKNQSEQEVKWQANVPYNHLPLLPPSCELETSVVLKACIEAHRALGQLKQAALLIPNQSVLINTLPLLEAKSSSEIENIVTTTDQLFRHQANDEQADPATKEALRYRQALLEGFQALSKHPLTTRTAEIICSKIKGVDMVVRRVPGVALADGAKNVVYTPPESEARLRDLLRNWEQFMHEHKQIDPLIRMAVGHYQFEAIHPFTDGNGRTGRVLNSLFLIETDLLTLPILYLSRYIIRTREDYYKLLLSVTRDQHWVPWILYFIKGIAETADWTREKIESVRSLIEHTSDYVKNNKPKVYRHELITLIFEQPYCRIQDVIDAGIAQRQAASRYLKELVDLGVLEEHAVGREKVFIHLKYLNLMTQDDHFAKYV